MSTQPKQPEWTYSQYRAMLRRNGVNYAIVSPDHVNALSEEQAKELLDLLNGQSAAHQIAAHTSAAVAEAVKPLEEKLDLAERRQVNAQKALHDMSEPFDKACRDLLKAESERDSLLKLLTDSVCRIQEMDGESPLVKRIMEAL